MPSQQPPPASSPAKLLDCIEVHDSEEMRRLRDLARSALDCGARHEAPLCRSAEHAKAKPLADRLTRSSRHRIVNFLHHDPVSLCLRFAGIQWFCAGYNSPSVSNSDSIIVSSSLPSLELGALCASGSGGKITSFGTWITSIRSRKALK